MNQLVYYTDGDIQSQLATKYNLLIHVGKSTLRYVLVDFVKDQIKALAEYEFTGTDKGGIVSAMADLSENSKLFKYTFNSVRVSFDSFNYVLIPEDLYDRTDNAAYAKFTSLSGQGTVVSAVRSARIKNIAEVDPAFSTGIENLFQRPVFYNQATPFLEITAKTISSTKPVTLFTHFDTGNFQIAVYRDRQLLFYNIFPVSNADEFNYFLLQVLDETNIDTTGTEVVVSGDIKPGDEYDSRLSKYFDDVHLADVSDVLSIPGESNAAQHRFFSLIGLHLCE